MTEKKERDVYDTRCDARFCWQESVIMSDDGGKWCQYHADGLEARALLSQKGD